ncbi:vomeronasal type-2 receptor 26-like [Eublepharis macularius]|uniref:Vomeronasal type-2 receptor 26-like n=1 Tax=Eublepharis macularius TaxID=481883 RepID=A0AA97LCM6_EUBMA|nr:vomeronasal type-2 receptor 26-like [Eublepharis macularius]
MVPNETQQYIGIVRLLKHFGWTWVGLFVVNGDSGEHFLEVLEPLLSQNGICLAVTKRIKKQSYWNRWEEVMDLISNVFQPLAHSKARAFVIYGESMTAISLITQVALADFEYKENAALRKVWITTAQIDFVLTGLQWGWDYQFLHGAISFTIHSKEIPGFQTFLHDIKPDWTKGDGFCKEFWEQAFFCSFLNYSKKKNAYKVCSGQERLESLPAPIFEMHMLGHSYGIYNAVYAIGHALHAIYTSRAKHRAVAGKKKVDLQEVQPWQLHLFLQGISFNNSAGETVSFNEKMEIGAGFDITNLVTFPNRSFHRVKVGQVNRNALGGEEFIIHEDIIEWQTSFNQSVPLSLCNDPCVPGYQKKKKEGKKFCCYDCMLCPEGKISSQKDLDDCIKCPEDHYPSKVQDQCIPKEMSFLSFEEPLGISLASVAVSFALITVSVLGTFIKHRDTPIVKANNRNITYSLLTSLLLCFLCPLLFLGRPKEVTCFFQQSAFGIIFTVAVSCILAKTITVVVAFIATKPGSKMRKWVGKRLTNCIVLSCSIVQMCICAVWLGITPPFPDIDTKSMAEEIIVECNEGSVTMFYIVLGYMGLLSLISLTVAFFARKLPDSFNEAKFITFSMLIFCSVWVSFVPSYQSTNGKCTVAVEIFSILASSAALLACVFSPKCYIIVLRPELNKREQLIRRKKEIVP